MYHASAQGGGACLSGAAPHRVDVLVRHERLGHHVRVSGEDVDDAARQIARVQHLRSDWVWCSVQ